MHLMPINSFSRNHIVPASGCHGACHQHALYFTSIVMTSTEEKPKREKRESDRKVRGRGGCYMSI